MKGTVGYVCSILYAYLGVETLLRVHESRNEGTIPLFGSLPCWKFSLIELAAGKKLAPAPSSKWPHNESINQSISFIQNRTYYDT